MLYILVDISVNEFTVNFLNSSKVKLDQIYIHVENRVMQEFREFYRALWKEVPDPLWFAVFIDHHTKLMDQLFIWTTSRKI